MPKTYEAPAIHQIFSAELKKEMIDIKFLRIVDHVKKQVITNFNEYQFREGLRIYTSRYECTELDPYFAEDDAKLRFLRDAIAVGFNSGLEARDIDAIPLLIGRKFKDDAPNTALITVTSS